MTRDEIKKKWKNGELLQTNQQQQNKYGKGNIDLTNRPVVKNKDGSISTVRSMSFYDDNEKKEILVPTIINGKQVSDNDAIKHYYSTGQYLGKFDSPEEATRYAETLHEQQEKMYKNQNKQTTPKSTWDNVKEVASFMGKKFGLGVQSGVTGIEQAYLTDTANQLQKGEKKNKLQAGINLANNFLLPDNIASAMTLTQDANETAKDLKGKNALQKAVGIATSASSSAMNAMPFKRKTNAIIQALGTYLKDYNPSKQALNLNDIVSMPINKSNEKLAKEGEQFSKPTQFVGNAMQAVGNMAPSIMATAVTRNPSVRTRCYGC